jgi:molybdenum cofactor guanylyltransferase
VIGAVLAGGRSSRFGADKAAHVWRGQTLLEWAKGSLSGCESVHVIGGRSNPDPEPHLGALWGLARALECGQAARQRVAVTACDMPNLTPQYWSLLEQHDADVVIAHNQDGQLEPLAAVYTSRCLPFVQAALDRGDLKLTAWWVGTDLEVYIVAWSVLLPRFGARLFLNANRLEDLP